ncbi:MAG: MBL fold metallo-hydrolase [Myxococcota bacterium]
MITSVKAGPFTVRGVSVGGVYTSLMVPELDVMFDVGMPLRSFAGVSQLFLSHAHVDHVGGLTSFLGIRALVGKRTPLRVFLPEEIASGLQAMLTAAEGLQRYSLDIDAVPMTPGQVAQVRGDLWVRAVRTHHPVPSLGYQLFRRIKKLRPRFAKLSGPEIARRRRSEDPADRDMFEVVERSELAYATDTLVGVLDNEPSLYDSRVLILECTFLDQRKSLEAARAGCHIHLDELIERAEHFATRDLVLMHFSQIYKPTEVSDILRERCPPELFERITPFTSGSSYWPG